MKQLFLLMGASLLTTSCFAKIWRVNNNAGVDADFTTAQQAHDGAAAGDTLHLEASLTPYGALTLTKRLTIISIGDFLSATPNLQIGVVTGRLNTLNINSSGASNSVFHCNVVGNVSILNASGIRFERCHIEGILSLSNTNSATVVNNFLLNVVLNNAATNVVIANNIIENYVNVPTGCSAVISNNVLRAQTTAATSGQIQNSTFQNNIINKTGLTLAFTNSIVRNNISSEAQFAAANGNVTNVNMATVFVNPSGVDDVSFQLQTASANPAAGAGQAGVDCGAFGGGAPYRLGLPAPVPAIYKLTVPATPSGNTMTIQFSTRSNN